MDNQEVNYWRKCSACKNPIPFGARYYNCSVSTCNNQRTGYVFCSVPCFERHLPGARHKDAAAVESKAPTAGQRIIVNKPMPHAASTGSVTRPQTAPTSPAVATPREVLVIASRLKEYIAAISEFNTSASVMDILSDHLRIVCQRGVENARAEGRKTVMERDFHFLKSGK
jgi:hypothetical protein